MSMLESLKSRRTVYALGRDLPISDQEVIKIVEEATELVPDAFNMKSARVVVVQGEAQERLWDAIYDVFEGKVERAKIDGFKAGAGTILYFTDTQTVESLQGMFAAYADNFPVWAEQANGMLQLAVWGALRDAGVGANLQHYNPIIDQVVRDLTGVPETYVLRAQMVYGSIVSQPDDKEKEDITQRVSVVR